MNDAELTRLVGLIQVGDNRVVDELTLGFFKSTVGHLAYDDAKTAVLLHRQESTEYLTPAHIIAIANRERIKRGANLTDMQICEKWGPSIAVNGVCGRDGLHIDDHPQHLRDRWRSEHPNGYNAA